MQAVRASTGQAVIVRCSEPLAQRLGMIRIAAPAAALLERHRLVLVVTASRPYPLLSRTYLWPWEGDPGPLEG